jgi:hypothetical protein
VAITCARKGSDDPADKKDPNDKTISYKISLIVDGTKLDQGWTLSTPKYIAPKPKTDKPKPVEAKPADGAKPADSGKTQPAK